MTYGIFTNDIIQMKINILYDKILYIIIIFNKNKNKEKYIFFLYIKIKKK